MNTSRRGLVLGLVWGLILLFTPRGYPATVEGFEAGDPVVTTAGDAIIKQTYQGVVPPQGLNQFLITTINSVGQDGTDGYSNQSGTNAVINSTLQTFFNSTSLLGTEGSGFKLSIVVPVGMTTITFRYDFLTTEFPVADGGHADFAFALLFDATNTLLGGVRNIATPASIDESNPARLLPSGPTATNPFTFDTGYQTFTISGLSPGTYTLGIGVEDRTTTDNPSGLLVDNISVVPEPSTVGLGMAGAVLLIALRRVIKKTS